MKKIIITLTIGIWVLPSCKKDYTCKCTTTSAGVTSDSTFVVTKTNVTKSDAEAACNKKTATKTCEII